MKSTFQTVTIIIFGIGFVAAVAVFSGLLGSPKKSTSTEPEGVVYVWGVIPTDIMSKYVDQFNSENVGYTISYEEHKPETFTNDLVNTLADGSSPDIVIFSSEIISQFKNKLYTIPYAAYAERSYRDTHIDGAQMFLSAEGITALPLVVDPLVVYYNKDILAGEDFIVPPKTWNTLVQTVPIFTRRNADNNIIQSTVALGDAQNVTHMRDILTTLFLQTGNKIISYDPVLKRDQAVLTSGSPTVGALPTAEALNFYTSFANTTNSNYSWNRSLPTSLEMFLSGKSAFYIGRASELFSIQAQNPNLNFDVQEMFQPEGAIRPVTFGSFIGIGVMKSAPNFNAAYAFLNYMTTPQSVDMLSKAMSLPPVRKDLLLIQQNNPYISVFFKAALSAFAWPDPNSGRTEQIFRAMINNVSSGRTDAETAIYEANRDLQSSIK